MTAPASCVDCDRPSDGRERRDEAGGWLVLPLCPTHRREASIDAADCYALALAAMRERLGRDVSR